MKRQILVGVVFVLFLAGIVLGGLKTEIWYQTSEFGLGRWQYIYDVKNISLTAQIEEFTIWFEFGLYENLAIETSDPPASNWSEIVIQPEPVLKDDGAYDARALNLGIGIGETVKGFTVSFDWLGDGIMPGSQFYEIIDTTTYQTIDSGWTVPEPATFILFCLSGAALCRRRKQRTEDR
jgi:hypothetical protein